MNGPFANGDANIEGCFLITNPYPKKRENNFLR